MEYKLTLAAARVDTKRAGATRALAAFVDESDADVLCVHDIDAGDALALATRFAREWAYRGNVALFWNGRFSAQRVHDGYLPASPLRPFDRHGLLQIDGMSGDVPLALFATQLSLDRGLRSRELRVARSAIRACETPVVAFVAMPDRRVRLQGNGFDDVAPESVRSLGCYVRGFVSSSARAVRDGGLIDEAMICEIARAL